MTTFGIEDWYIGFMAGLLTSYLMIRAVRGMGSRVGLAVFLCCTVAQGGPRNSRAKVTIVNSGGSAITDISGLQLKVAVYYGGAFWNAASLSSISSLAAGASRDYYTTSAGPSWDTSAPSEQAGCVSSGCTGLDLPYLRSSLGNIAGTWATSSCPGDDGGTSTANEISGVFTWNGSSWSGGAATYTNAVFSGLSITNTGGFFDSAYRAVWKTNDGSGNMIVARTDDYVLDPNEPASFPASTNLFGAGVGYTVDVYGPGSLANDYVPVVVASGSSTPVTGGTSESSSGSYAGTVTQGDPIGSKIGEFTPSTTNSLIADRQNALGIVEAIRDLGQGLSRRLEPGTNGFGLTNSPDYSAVLERIRTNTAGTFDSAAYISNMLAGATNVGASTNMIFDTMNQFSNLVAGQFNGSLGTNFNNLSNAVGTAQSSGLWHQIIDAPTGNPMEITLMRGATAFVMNFDLFSGASPWVAKILGGATFLSRLVAGVLVLVLFWSTYTLMNDRLLQIQGCMAVPLSKAPSITELVSEWKFPLFRLLTGVGIITAGTALLMILPTAVIAYMDGKVWVPFPNAASLKYQMTTGGGMGNSVMDDVAAKYWNILNTFIPFATLGTGLLNWATVRFLIDRATNFVLWLCRAIGVATACLALCVGGRSEAATVVVENMTGSDLVMSNSADVVTVQPGRSQVWLPAADWYFTSTNYLATSEPGSFDPTLCLRFARDATDTNSPQRLVASIDEVPNMSVGFWQGWWVGLSVFGFAWMASAVVSGLRVGVRGYE